MMRFITLLVLIPIILIVAVFAFRNAEFVKIDLLIDVFNLPLAAVILVSLVVGVLIGFAINIFILIRQRNTIRMLNKRKQTLSGLADILKSSDE